MSSIRMIFLSAVSSEFGDHRRMLKADLNLPGVKVQEQEDLVQSGGKLLQTLDDYIRDSCDAVIHLVGRESGQPLKQDEVRWLLDTYGDFTKRFPFLLDDLRSSPVTLTYTQMEAWLALYHSQRCHLYQPAELQHNPLPEDHSQQKHWARLKDLGEHRGTFEDVPHLCRRVLRDLNDILPSRPLFRGASARFSPGLLTASLAIIICLLAGIWGTMIRGRGIDEIPQEGVKHSVLFNLHDVPDDAKRLAGAESFDVVDLAAECQSPVLNQLAVRFETQPDVMLRFARAFVEMQTASPTNVLDLTDEVAAKLSSVTESTAVLSAQQCENALLKRLASEFSNEPSVLLIILQELRQ